MGMAEEEPCIITAFDPKIHRLPLNLIKSETIPPSPNLSISGSSAIDWLPDFAGHSWISYGASSLLVISHFPSSLSRPIFRQVFELHSSASVVSVAWSPAIPSSADLAAAVDNRVFLLQYDSSPGSFCWRQTALLVQSAKIEAIAWTGSGDGVISVGREVVLWKRSVKCWEIAWKFCMKVPQSLISATWSLKGLLATGVFPTVHHNKGSATVTSNANDHVSIFQYDGKTGHLATELRHPQPVSAIQWRPCGGRQLKGDALHVPRHVLLTSCLDGAVRLWCEIDGSRTRKGNKDDHEQSAPRLSFCVVAVIEINQSVGGILGSDVFVYWALETEGTVSSQNGLEQLSISVGCQHDDIGSCEWLIGVGPGQLLTFWSVHCLDDISTMRSPRVTLWKRLEVTEPDSRIFCRNNGPRSPEGYCYNKVAIHRNRHFAPPVKCSLVKSYSGNSLTWSTLYNQSLQKVEGNSPYICEADKNLSCQHGGIFDTRGHSGKILQVSVNPFMHDVELAVSLDADGLLIFWSISTSINSFSGLPTFTPSWQLVGMFNLQYTMSQQMSLYWVPSWLEENQILLIGHAQGIDCLIVKTSVPDEDKILCHKLCTIPFSQHDHLDGLCKLFSIPLQFPSEDSSSKCNQFLLLGIWVKNCQFESWKVMLKSHELSENGHLYNSDAENNVERNEYVYKANFAGKTYCMVVSPCSSYIPGVDDEVTSLCVPSISVCSLQHRLVNDPCRNDISFHLATGHADGRSRLWRINLSEISIGRTSFDLVGMLNLNQCPITAISVADQGQKIATICSDGHENNVSMLCIWEPLHLIDTGTLVLEDKICLQGKVVALKWFQMENLLYLGVCFQNELHIYARRVCGVQDLPEASTWVCIGVAHTSLSICDFILGPSGTLTVIHEYFFAVFNQWSFFSNNKHQINQQLSTDASTVNDEMDMNGPTSLVGRITVYEELSVEKSKEDIFSPPSTKVHSEASFLNGRGTQPIAFSLNKYCFLKMTIVAEKLCGPLPFFHPEALLTNIYSGNWRRAYAAVCHLVDCLTLNSIVDHRITRPESSISIRQIKLSEYFEGQLSKGGSGQGIKWNNDLDTNAWSQNTEGLMHFTDTFTSDGKNHVTVSSATSFEPSRFSELLEKLHPHQAVTDLQKMQMLAIADLLFEISNSQSASAYESLDDSGKRFWCALRLQQLDCQRKYSRTPLIKELVVDSRLMVWAFHSDCQEILFNSILSTEPTWEDMRKLGVGFWLTNLSDLRNKMEKLARSQYLKNKDPKACALLYIALNRLQVLAGLFKISKDEKDKPLVAFLSRNFQDEKHRAAALKNAYVLMGRHQYELAIAFFLLGGDIISAITVCSKTLGDDQLALVICRLIEGVGGPSEHHLISKILLPSAMEKGNYWLASVLQWLLGCYLQSFLVVLGLQDGYSAIDAEKLLKHAAFLDPSIGQYCQMLVAKNCLRNAVGEKNTAILCRWSTVMTASAFDKCGLPLDGLECLSSSATILGVLDKRPYGGDSEILPTIMRPFPANSFLWLSHEIASYMSYQAKLDLAMRYVVKLVKEHPLWLKTKLVLTKADVIGPIPPEHEISEYGALCEDFEQLLISELGYMEHKFSVAKDLLLEKIHVPLVNFRLLLSDYLGFTSQVHMPATSHTDCNSSGLLKQFVHVTKHLSYSFSSLVIGSSIASSWTSSSEQSLFAMKPYRCFHFLEFYVHSFVLSITSLTAGLMLLCKSNSRELVGQYIAAFDLCKYCIYFASAILQHNLKALDALLRPILAPCTDGNREEFDSTRLRTILGFAVEALSFPDINDFLGCQRLHPEDEGDTLYVTSEYEEWMILRFCFWQNLLKFVECQLNQLSSKISCDVATTTSEIDSSISYGDCSLKHVRQALSIFVETIKNNFACISSHIARQLAVFLLQKVEGGTSVPFLMWLENFDQSTLVHHGHQYRSLSSYSSETMESENSHFKILAKICDCPKTVSELLAQIPIKLSELIHWKGGKGWNHLHFSISGEPEKLESYKQEGIFDSSPCATKSKNNSADSEQIHGLLDSDRKGETIAKKVVPFNNPKEVYRRNGELLEAFCLNSIDQQQGALASNRKGISYFSWGDGAQFKHSSDYLWENADWPHNGWASTESAPVSAFLSSDVSLGSDRSTQLSVSSEAKIGRDLTGGGAFGIPGYAGIGATGLGWGIPEEFDKFDDPPATLSNVMGSALTAHPSRPFFLVGSSNTHIYLWEFGEEKAVATYGVLPAANIPPPYTLASVTGLQFDCFGHRFASSASDGTVSAWQLEVGGRSNVTPTESSLCFNGPVSDVCYVATSGSIIAAAGYSSNGVNVVVWDTLAPPSSSRASVMCHEGGACSIAVFDNDVGTGSISPLIVTGGKDGDVGLHDFRYIATGKTKRQRQFSNFEKVTDTAAIDIRSELSSVGDHNRHGMLWYIPKAHSGSVTKISTIPNTSFFLTGSKDGDVKLWDAKKARLVFHWPRLHERHTFLQRSSQGFGGVTRVGLTDIQVISDGFLTCGGDGLVKLIQLNNAAL